MNAIAQTQKISLISQIWNFILMHNDFEHDVTIEPHIRYIIILIEKIGLPIVFCCFMGYMWLGMLAKYDKQEEMIFKMQQDNCVAFQEFSRNVKELKEAVTLASYERRR